MQERRNEVCRSTTGYRQFAVCQRHTKNARLHTRQSAYGNQASANRAFAVYQDVAVGYVYRHTANNIFVVCLTFAVCSMTWHTANAPFVVCPMRCTRQTVCFRQWSKCFYMPRIIN